MGVDVAYLRQLCAHWAARYDWRAFESRLNGLSNHRWSGLHLIWERSQGDGLPVILIHGWPGAAIEFLDVIPRLVAAGHDVVVPSLPGLRVVG